MLAFRSTNFARGQIRRSCAINTISTYHTAIATNPRLRVALSFSRTYTGLLRSVLAGIAPNAPPAHSPIRAAFERLQTLIDQACQEAQLAAR